MLAGRVLEQMEESVAADLERAEQLVEQVLAVSPRHALAHFAKAQVLRGRGRFDAAIPEYEIAIAANLNWVVAIANLGLCKFFAGSIEEAIPAQQLAIRLSPRDPRLLNWYWRVGMVHLLQSRVEETISWLEKARSFNPQLPRLHGWLASAYALIGVANVLPPARRSRRLGGDRFLLKHRATSGRPALATQDPECSRKRRFSPACARRGCRRNSHRVLNGSAPPSRAGLAP